MESLTKVGMKVMQTSDDRNAIELVARQSGIKDGSTYASTPRPAFLERSNFLAGDVQASNKGALGQKVFGCEPAPAHGFQHVLVLQIDSLKQRFVDKSQTILPAEKIPVVILILLRDSIVVRSLGLNRVGGHFDLPVAEAGTGTTCLYHVLGSEC